MCFFVKKVFYQPGLAKGLNDGIRGQLSAFRISHKKTNEGISGQLSVVQTSKSQSRACTLHPAVFSSGM